MSKKIAWSTCMQTWPMTSELREQKGSLILLVYKCLEKFVRYVMVDFEVLQLAIRD